MKTTDKQELQIREHKIPNEIEMIEDKINIETELLRGPRTWSESDLHNMRWDK